MRVDGRAISRASVEHWIPIEAVISRLVSPKQPVPKGFVPDPPHYAACIGYLKGIGRREADPGSTGSIMLIRRQCRQRYENVRRHVLEILITFQWLLGESGEQHVALSPGELERAAAQFRSANFQDEAGFQRYLKYSGESLADELLVERMDPLATKLQQVLVARDGATTAGRIFTTFPKRWAARTSCSPGYVVPDCRQYKGPLQPEAAT